MFTPVFYYEHCSLVSEKEAESVVVYDHPVEGGAVRLGGACAWAVILNGEFYIYSYVLTFDLFATCCDRNKFPSMSRLYSESVFCDSVDCLFCRDHGKHVDPEGRYLGCVPDSGKCLCYAPCTTPSARITRSDHLPFFTEHCEKAVSLELKKSSFSVIGHTPDTHIAIRDEDGNDVELKCNSWNLVKFDPALSRLIILACPVLKKLVDAR